MEDQVINRLILRFWSYQLQLVVVALMGRYIEVVGVMGRYIEVVGVMGSYVTFISDTSHFDTSMKNCEIADILIDDFSEIFYEKNPWLLLVSSLFVLRITIPDSWSFPASLSILKLYTVSFFSLFLRMASSTSFSNNSSWDSPI